MADWLLSQGRTGSKQRTDERDDGQHAYMTRIRTKAESNKLILTHELPHNATINNSTLNLSSCMRILFNVEAMSSFFTRAVPQYIGLHACIPGICRYTYILT